MLNQPQDEYLAAKPSQDLNDSYYAVGYVSGLVDLRKYKEIIRIELNDLVEKEGVVAVIDTINYFEQKVIANSQIKEVNTMIEVIQEWLDERYGKAAVGFYKRSR